jgi:hypothetical protein
MTSGVPIDPIPVGGPPLVGEIVDFDEARGVGLVQVVGGRSAPFHCTAIADGSRRIEVGTVVALRLAAGRLGRTEARWVRPLPGVTSRGASLRVANGRLGDPPSQLDQLAPGLALGPVPSLPVPAVPVPSVSDADTPPSGTPPVAGPVPGDGGEAGPAASSPPSPD